MICITALSTPITLAQAMTCPEVQALVEAAKELFEYASYAEIVGGIRVNRPQIQEWCDKTSEAIRPFNDALFLQEIDERTANAD